MPRKAVYEQSLGTDRWILSDPLDTEIIERLCKKGIREGEEKLMLAVLASAIQHFQKYAFRRMKEADSFPRGGRVVSGER